MSLSKILLNRLQDKSLVPSAGYINGEWITTSCHNETFDIYNPATGELIATLPDLGVQETISAIDAAHVAQKQWAANSASIRSKILRRLYDLILENCEDLALIITLEMGKPLAEARNEVMYGAAFIEWFAEEAKRIYGDIIPNQQPDNRLVVLKQAIGVVGTITPWNFPNAMLTRKMAPALAVGCSVVAKPAEATPLSAIALAVLGERAGLPAGVLNVIPGLDSAGIGQEMFMNPKLRKISFTGSTNVGRILMRQCADQIKKLSLELGGNAPFIVFEDADLDAAVQGLMISKFRNNGQTCVCTNRIYIQDSIYDAFQQKFATEIAKLKVGDGLAENITIGPLINDASLAKIERLVAEALGKGAKLILGGKRLSPETLYYEPTLLGDVRPDMKIAQEEVFGPIAPLFKFDTVEDIIHLANDTPSGLAAYFYTSDHTKIWRVAEALEFGIIGVNTGFISTEVAPFGGIKQSGLGREGSKYGADDYLELKYVCMGNIK